jgi:hypothetical protein
VVRRLRRSTTATRRPPAPTTVAVGPLPAVGTVGEVTIDGHDRRWLTRIDDRDGTHLVLVAPTRPRGEAILPEVGAVVRFGWAAETGFREAAGVLAGTGEDVVATWVLAVRTVEKRQRRGAFRLAVSVPVELVLGARTLAAITRDLSEGGLRCVLPLGSQGEPGDRVEVRLALPDAPPVEAAATVVRRRVEPPSAAGPGEVELGVAFVDADPSRAEALRRFVFAEQLRRRSAG